MNTQIISNLIITRVYSASTFYTPANVKKKKTRNRWAIIIKYEGETLYTSNGKQFLSNSTHIILLPNGCSYQWECTKEGRFCSIEFECETTLNEPITIHVKNSDKILKAFKDIEHKRNVGGDTKNIESIRDLYSILITLVNYEPKTYVPTKKQRIIANVIEYISKNYNKKLTNDELSKIANLSTVYFRRLFTEITGVSPIAYLHKVKIEKAKEILSSDYGTISQVADMLGYQNIYDFSRDFKKHTGISPSNYKN